MADKMIRWSGVSVAVQTAIGNAQEITQYTVAGEDVTVTYTGADPEEGAYIHVQTSSYAELRDCVFRVKSLNAEAKTFILDGLDGTLLDVTAAPARGTFGVLTLGAEFETVQTVTPSGGEFETEDRTTIHDRKRRNEVTIPSAEQYAFNNFFSLEDQGYLECLRATKKQTPRAVLFTFPNGVKLAFVASVGAGRLPGGQAHTTATIGITLALKGDATILDA